jgi:hypothetical protein
MDDESVPNSRLRPMKTIQTQPTQVHNPIDPQSLIQHGESPTSIILAITILLAILFQSMTRLIAVILKRQK